MGFIYKITNQINGKIYIGKTSSSIEERFREHLSDAQKPRCEKRPLYDAINKYGKENFFIERIEEVPNDEIANEREQFWINELRTYIGFEDCNGYNATLGGDSKRYYDYDELANAYLELKTVKEVCKKYNCDEKTVRNACKEKNITIKIAPNKRKIIRKKEKKENEEIEYNSVSEAARELATNKEESERIRKNISRALRVKGTAYGYSWLYNDAE